jgi:hypothetical protein
MTLAMIRPYKHPKTGVYWLRKVVPVDLRAAVGKRELIRSLGTKDPKEARARAPAVIAELEAVLEAARAGGDRLTLKEITALCGEWYRAECELWGDNPDQVGDLDIYEDLLIDQIERSEDEDRDPTREAVVKLTAQDRAEAAALLKTHRYPADPAAANRLARAIFDMRFQFIGAG